MTDTEWPSDRVTEWLSDRVAEWPSDRVTEWTSDQVTEWLSNRKLRRRLTGWYILIIRTRYLWMFEVLTFMWKMKVSVTYLYEMFVLANYSQSTSRELATPAAGRSSADWWPTAARLQCTVSGPGTWPVGRQNMVYIYCQFCILK